jgi:hypothetical protein
MRARAIAPVVCWVALLGGGGCGTPCRIEGVVEDEPRIEVLSSTFGEIDDASDIIACSRALDDRWIEMTLRMTFARPDDDCAAEIMVVRVVTYLDGDAFVRDGDRAACILPAGPAELELTLYPPPLEVPAFLVGSGTLEIREAVYSEAGDGVLLRGEVHFDLAVDWSPPFPAGCPWRLGLRFEAPPCPPDEE